MKEEQGVAGLEVAPRAESNTLRTGRSITVHQAVLALALVLTFVAYCGSLGYPFVYDDHGQIVMNSSVHSWRFVPQYFTQHVWESIFPGMLGNYYRPLFLLWLRINHLLFGLKPWGWHLTSVLAHLAVTVFVYLLAGRLIGDRLTAAVAAMIFGLHPVHVESVAWVSGVTEPLMGLLFIPSFLCYLKAREGGSRARAWLAASLFLYLASMFAKETALVFPMLVFACEWVFSPAGEGTTPVAHGQRIRNAIWRTAPYLAIAPFYVVARTLALKGFSHSGTPPPPFSMIMLTWPKLLWFYMMKMVWPVGLSLSYRMPYVQNLGFLDFYLPAAGLAAGAFLLWAWARKPGAGLSRESKSRVVAFALAWLLVPILPVLDIALLPKNDAVHDRYLYLPSVGLAIIAALGLRSVKIGRARLAGQPAIQVVLAAMIAFLFVVGAISESVFWGDDLLLYYRALTIAPDNDTFRTNLAIALAERGHNAESMSLFHEVLSRNPNLWEPNYNLGLIYYRLGKLHEAEHYFRQAIRVDPNLAAALFYLGLSELKEGRVEEAAATIHQVVRINPKAYDVHFARGMILKLQGDLTGALEEFKVELNVNPEQTAAKEQIAEIEGRLRRHPSEGSSSR